MSNATGLYCMEEPENGIHPEKLSSMHNLLLDIAIDVQEPIGPDNLLRQVVVATHSPYFVMLQDKNDLVLARDRPWKSENGEIRRVLKCSPCKDSWRCNGGARDYVDLISLQSYLMPPDDAQIAFPRSFWSPL